MKTYSIIRKNTGGQLRGNRVQLNCNLTKSQADSEIKEMAEIHASEIEMPEAEVAEFVALAVEDSGDAPAGGVHRLRPGRREVEDRERRWASSRRPSDELQRPSPSGPRRASAA